jgi:hypothetical protein
MLAGGAGLALSNASVGLVNCTVASNLALGVIGSAATNLLFQGYPGGIYNPTGTVTLLNTLVSDNRSFTNDVALANAPEILGAVLSQGHNLVSNTNGVTGLLASDLQGVSARLLPLRDNGGPTFTHGLACDSPAINSGSSVGAPLFDQRGVARPQGAAVDIGALEFDSTPGLPLAIVSPPESQTTLPGSNLTLRVETTGVPPITYRWWKNGVLYSSSNSPVLDLPNAQTNDSGTYWLAMTDCFGAVTSAPAVVRVQYVVAKVGTETLVADQYSFVESVEVALVSSFRNGLIFYTLDGSAPTFESTLYTEPITITRSARLRTVAYSADFLVWGRSAPIDILIIPTYTLSVTANGGSVNVAPAQSKYVSNSVATLTATPSAGWMFLGWAGDASGSSADITIRMSRDRCVEAVFATSVFTTVAGKGSVVMQPAGGIYPYGTVVRLYGVPQPGNYFAWWGNAGSGSNNPLSFAVTTTNQTVSSLFGSLSATQRSLVVLPSGKGSVTVTPALNRYTNGARVTVTAIPEAEQTFLGWSGDASGGENPLTLTMTASRVITANFTRRPVLRLWDCSGQRDWEVFQFTISGDYGERYRIDRCTNLTAWTSTATLTNTFGTVQFTDLLATNPPQRFYRAYREP